MSNISFLQPLRTGSLIILLWIAKTDPFILEFRMKMKENGLNNKWTLNERFVNAKWAQGERFLNGERERSGERKWTRCERTVNARKIWKVERFGDCIWYFCIYIVYISFVFFVAIIWNIKTNLVHISNAENTHVYEMFNANGKWL